MFHISHLLQNGHCKDDDDS